MIGLIPHTYLRGRLRHTSVRMRHHQPTRNYVERRTAEGLTKREIIRCLKRYIAREVYNNLPAAPHRQRSTKQHQHTA